MKEKSIDEGLKAFSVLISHLRSGGADIQGLPHPRVLQAKLPRDDVAKCNLIC
jgi:hypothetical protein